MNQAELINIIKDIALSIDIKTVTNGDVYNLWNSNEIKYSAVNVAVEDTSYDEDYVTYNFILYYGDRLLQDESNFNYITIDGERIINNIINTLKNTDDIDVITPYTITPFQQQFADYLGGVYCKVGIQTVADMGCNNGYDFTEDLDVTIDKNGNYSYYSVKGYNTVEIDVNVQPETELLNKTITENGSYKYQPSDNILYNEVNIDVNVVPQLENKSVNINKNGTYYYKSNADYDGINGISVKVDVPQPETTSLNVNLYENGTHTYTPTENTLYDKVNVKVNVNTLQGIDLMQIGYSDSYNSFINQDLYTNTINYAKSEAELIYESKLTTFLAGRYSQNLNIIFFPNIDLSKFTSLQATFNFSGLLYFDNTTTYNITTFHRCFRQSPVRYIRCNTDKATTLQSFAEGASSLKFLELTSVENVTIFTSAFNMCLNLEEIKFIRWKQGNITMNYASMDKIKPECIRFILDTALTKADGAVARTLYLTTAVKDRLKASFSSEEQYNNYLGLILDKTGITIA